jgi:hypothetical protein
MEQSSARGKLLDALWFFTWAIASSVWCLTAAVRLGATWDEPDYVARGLEHWRTGSYHGLMKLGTMPLPVDAVSLPLYVAERWRGRPFDPNQDLAVLLPWARAGTLAFWWLLLAYGRLAGRRLAGPWGGRLAVAFLAVEPSFLAHASLATTDIAISACLLALVYHFRTAREAGWAWRVAVPMLWFAAAVLAKASGLVFGPLCLLAVEVERLLRCAEREPLLAEVDQYAALPYRTWRSLRTLGLRLWASWRDFAQIGVGGLALVFVYCGSDWEVQRSFVDWARQLPAGRAHTALVWLAEHLRVFSNAGEGIVRQVTHNIRGHGAFLCGRWHPRALWYYFPVILTIKLSLPLLVAPFLLALVRPRALRNWACVAAGMLLVFSLACRVQIGIRFMLPLAALAVVGLTGAVVQTCRAWGGDLRSKLLGTATAAGLVWTAAGAVLVWPEALCYVNELWGGTVQGYRHVSEANYDWGQGLKELAALQKRRALVPLDVWYFGKDPLLSSLPMRHLPLHFLPLTRPEEVAACVRGHFLAVSTYYLTMPDNTAFARPCAADFLQTRRPVARTATFFIYDFTGAERKTASR